MIFIVSIADGTTFQTASAYCPLGPFVLLASPLLLRATRLEDLLLMRAPPASFLLQGPPASLRQQLEKFAARTAKCRHGAAELARELGFEEFLH